MSIIGLTCEPNASESDTAAYLIKEYGYERKSLVDPIKRTFSACVGVPPWQIDQLKKQDNAFVSAYEYTPDGTWIPLTQHTFNETLTMFANSHRDMFGYNFWLDQVIPEDMFIGTSNMVVTDIEYPNEAERVRSVGGLVARISKGRGHEIEKAHRVEADWIIMDDGTPVDLYAHIDELIDIINSEGSMWKK